MSFLIRRSTRGLLLAGAIVIAVGIVFVFDLRQLQRADRAVRHSREVLLALERVLNPLQDAETGQRGYLLTGKPAYLAPYEHAQTALAGSLAELDRLTRDNSRQQSHLAALRRPIEEKLAEMRETITLRRDRGIAAALAVVQTDRGQTSMDAARNIIASMQVDENRLYAQRKQHADSSAGATILVALLGTFALLLIVARNVVVIGHDIDRREAVEESLRQAEQRLAVTLQSIGDALLATDRAGTVTYMNPIAEQLTGWTQSEAIGKDAREVFHIIDETSRLDVPSPIEQAIDENRIVALTNHAILIPRNGIEIFIDDSGAPIRDRDGSVIGAILVFRDITARKLAGKALQEQKATVDALNARLRRAMAETHHRVKNSLQIISALVDVQTMEASETVPTGALARVGQHVNALAVIHDLLTEEAKANVEANYLSTGEAMSKLRPLLESFVGDRRIDFTVDDFRLPLRQGTSLAVLVNELVSNAVKHGAGDIDVSLAVVEGRATLQVRDNGPGFAPGFDPRVAVTTGFELIESLGRWDLGGELSFMNHPDGGACVIVRFPAVADQDNFPSGSIAVTERVGSQARDLFSMWY